MMAMSSWLLEEELCLCCCSWKKTVLEGSLVLVELAWTGALVYWLSSLWFSSDSKSRFHLELALFCFGF